MHVLSGRTREAAVQMTMVRHYKRKTNRGDYSADVLQRAVLAVKDGMSFRQAADTFSVNKDTLCRAFKKEACGQTLTSFSSACRTRQVFTLSEEKELVGYIVKASRIGFPVDPIALRRLAYQLAQRNHKNYPATWDDKGQAGEDWLLRFQQKHRTDISSRTPEATSLSRATAFNRTNVEALFRNLSEVYQRHHFTADCVYNLDETGLTTSQKPQRVMAEAGAKQIPQLVSHERGENVTMLAFINAIGNTVPPCLIYPRVKFQAQLLYNAPPGTSGFANRCGWMTKEVFVQCLQHFVTFVHCSRERKVLLVLDNHDSHVSLEAVDFCRDNGIVLLSFPPHTTHRLQPLDKTVFGPFKRYFYSASNDWMYSNPGKRMTIHDISGLVGIAFPRGFSATNIISGFKSTGIFPLDTEIFTDNDFVQCFVTDQPAPRTDLENTVSAGAPSTTAEESSSHTNIADQPAPRTETENICTSAAAPSATAEDASTIDANCTDQPAEEHANIGDGTQPSPQDENHQGCTPTTEAFGSENIESQFAACSPENVRPHPKAAQRCGRKKSGRPPGRCRILTDTPEKAQLEEAAAKKRKAPPKTGQTGSKKRRLFQRPAPKQRKARRTCVMATYCQGDDLFSADTRGRQCTAMATSAAVYTCLKPIASWTKTDLDLILLTGDTLYTETVQQQPPNEDGYLLITDIADKVTLLNETFELKRSQAMCGLISRHRQLSTEATAMKNAIIKTFTNQPSAILIIKDSTVMLRKSGSDGSYYVFDSHSRNKQGLPSPEGKSVLMKLQDVNDLVCYLYEVTALLTAGVATYEIVGIEPAMEPNMEGQNSEAHPVNGPCSTAQPAAGPSSVTQPLSCSVQFRNHFEVSQDEGSVGLPHEGDSTPTTSASTDGKAESNKPESETCIFCGECFATSPPGEIWIQCKGCQLWGHEDCADTGTQSFFLCDFCKGL